MPQARYDFTGDNAIQLGETFTWSLAWKSGGVPVNLTNRTARMQWRKSFNATETIAEFSTVLGNLTLGGALGTIAATLTAAQTAVISAHGGVYDLEVIAIDGVVVNLIGGELEFKPEVTR